MRPPLLMFEETPEWDDLEVRVVIEVAGDSVEGRAGGNVTEQSRLDIVARASMAAAEAAAGRSLGELGGVSIGEINGRAFAVVVLVDPASADHVVGAAPWRHFEDQAQAVIRAVFDAVNRRSELADGA
jgi:hypothetical protein